MTKATRRTWFGLMCAGALGCSGGETAPGAPEITGQSGPPPTFAEFKASATRLDNGLYVVDEDILVSEGSLEAYYARHVSGGGALIVNHVGGVDSSWTNAQKRNITYCVSTGFGAAHDRIVQGMAAAASSWQNVADVRFVYKSAQDANCTGGNGNVAYAVISGAGASYYGGASYPGDSSPTILVNLPKLDTARQNDATFPLTLTGLLRHELGHALGFQHEMVRVSEPSNCNVEPAGRALTPNVDFASVMFYPHYLHPECNGRNDRQDNFLSQWDIEGAMALYGAQSNLVIAGDGTPIVRSITSGNFFSFANGTFTQFGGPLRQLVATEYDVYGLAPDGQSVLRHHNGAWSTIGGAAGQIFPCRWDRICATNPFTADVWQFDGTNWARIGTGGKKFVYGDPAGLYGLSPQADAIFQYTGTGTAWNFFGSGVFSDLIPTHYGVYAVDNATGNLLLADRGNFTIVGGPGDQFAGFPYKLVALTPGKTAVVEFNESTSTWTGIGGPAERVARVSATTTAVLSPTFDLCITTNSSTWQCFGQP